MMSLSSNSFGFLFQCMLSNFPVLFGPAVVILGEAIVKRQMVINDFVIERNFLFALAG